MHRDNVADERTLRRLSAFAAAWAAIYAFYRGYYAVGGTAGTLGVPVSESEFRYINAVAAVALTGTAVMPVLLLKHNRCLYNRLPLLILKLEMKS